MAQFRLGHTVYEAGTLYGGYPGWMLTSGAANERGRYYVRLRWSATEEGAVYTVKLQAQGFGASYQEAADACQRTVLLQTPVSLPGEPISPRRGALRNAAARKLVDPADVR